MVRFFLPIACLFLFATSALADEKPNTLTPKEIADGWILLFDGETTFGWKVEGDATVKDGKLVIGGAKDRSSATSTTEFADYEFRVDATGTGIVGAGGGGRILSSEQMQIVATVDTGRGTTTGLSETVRTLYHKNGPSSVQIKSKAGETISIRSIKLRPLGSKPLFNGKNLDGWKVTQADPKRTATKFEVTAAGELSAKNGPGDLQTEKQFDDFVLQLECKTNGLALNSGIFFRCMPDAYQNGYEAQIQNAYLGDRTKPIDFGTGAIYRRVAARKVVSNDKEWFTMTVAAQGAHMATWVNGYQVVDWTDDRKANDNPRQGLRTAKGHLSIQGHDPTTDLLFRNIRIAELPKP